MDSAPSLPGVSAAAADPATGGKLQRLRDVVGSLESVVVCYSGGADSALVLKVATDVLGDRATGLMGVSASFAPRELEAARHVAQAMGARLIEAATRETDLADYRRNPQDRCFVCRNVLYDEAREVARREGRRWIVDGTNADDVGHDFRPGLRAAKENGVRHPLVEAGLTKDDVRAVSRALGLETWSKPATACLSSRVPYGEEITPEKLAQIASAEEACRRILDVDVVRVRHHGTVARIEIPRERLKDALERSERLVEALRGVGFLYVTLDLDGFRSGSLNEALKVRDPRKGS